MDFKTGLVFGGGGGKGAYQAGVWKALEEMGVCGRIGGVSGASVGALNGAMFCAGDLQSAVKAWSCIDEGMILSRQGSHDSSWFSNEGIKDMIRTYINLTALKNSKTVFYAVASNIKKRPLLPDAITARYFKTSDYSETDIEKILLASAAIPVVFPDIVIDGSTYVDGGLKDNVPIIPLYDAGFRKILIVSLGGTFKLPAIKFHGAQFLVISLDESWLRSLGGTLDFTARDAGIRMERGYEDCMGMADVIYDFML
ncbi:MAG: patatin-like phospholipase family protein [Oscillospiraceae bacterium]|jgi:NTE family protein|nr:patatin-like phospholipase family protein [Oscillospiraceae bacterium]